MKTTLLISILALAFTACGGRLDERGNPIDDDSEPMDSQAQELRVAVNPVLTPVAPPNPLVAVGAPLRRAERLVVDPRAELIGKEPVLELDFSDGRVRVRLLPPADFVEQHLYSTEHVGGGCHR